MKIEKMLCGCVTASSQGISTALVECGKCEYSLWAQGKRAEQQKTMAEDEAYEEIRRITNHGT